MNKKRNVYLLLIIILALLIIKGAGWFNSNNTGDENFRDTSHLILTRHVKCRMDCRQITLEEIKEVLKKGKLNRSKSGEGAGGDRTYAVEGYSYENQHIRVIVAPENKGLVVITCIDLEKEWPCNCN